VRVCDDAYMLSVSKASILCFCLKKPWLYRHLCCYNRPFPNQYFQTSFSFRLSNSNLCGFYITPGTKFTIQKWFLLYYQPVHKKLSPKDLGHWLSKILTSQSNRPTNWRSISTGGTTERRGHPWSITDTQLMRVAWRYRMQPKINSCKTVKKVICL